MLSKRTKEELIKMIEEDYLNKNKTSLLLSYCNEIFKMEDQYDINDINVENEEILIEVGNTIKRFSIKNLRARKEFNGIEEEYILYNDIHDLRMVFM